LIVFLLVSYSSFSQIVTKSNDSVVTLSESQARKVIKDLIRYDALKLVNIKLEERIDLILERESVLKDRIKTKDSIITAQREYIEIQQSIIDTKTPIRFNGFVGVQTFQASLTEPTLYFQTEIQMGKVTLGARVFVQPNNPGGYGFVAEYKIF
jgi:hypothetical protein